MNKLELGTYVNCRDLPIEKVEKLLGKFVELAGGTLCEVDDISVYSKDADCYLVYCKEGHGNDIIWFWDDKFTCDKEMFYEDFFPEEQEDVVKRVRTIDLERQTEIVTIKTVNECSDSNLESLVYKLQGIDQSQYNSCFWEISNDELVISGEQYAESEEAYQNRVKREKELNDMYNKDIQQLQKKLTIAENKLKYLENAIKIISPSYCNGGVL